MGLIIIKKNGVSSIEYEKSVLRSASILKRAIFASVIIKRSGSILFFEGTSILDKFYGLTGLFSIKDEDKAFFSMIPNRLNNNVRTFYNNTLLFPFDVHYNGVVHSQKGPYFVLFGYYPSYIHKDKRSNFLNMTNYYTDIASKGDIPRLLINGNFEEVADQLAGLNWASPYIIGDDSEEYINNLNEYKSVNGVLVSSRFVASKLESDKEKKEDYSVISSPIVGKRVGFVQRLSRFDRFVSEVINNKDDYIFFKRKNYYGSDDLYPERYIIVGSTRSGKTLVLNSIDSDETHTIYEYELFTRYKSVFIKRLHGSSLA